MLPRAVNAILGILFPQFRIDQNFPHDGAELLVIGNIHQNAVVAIFDNIARTAVIVRDNR